MTWDSYQCPVCGCQADMGIMSLIARCSCGCSAVYISNYPKSGWYHSIDAYYAGMPTLRLPPAEVSAEDTDGREGRKP